MFFAAFKYFWGNAFKGPADVKYTHVSGAEYWAYRLIVEGVLFAVLYFALVATAFAVSTDSGHERSDYFIWASIATLVVATLELVRLAIELREQEKFDDLFYG